MHQESSFINENGHTIAAYRSVPKETPKAGLLLVHGYAEHTGRYKHLIRELNDSGLAVFAIDHQGHGRSEGTRCDIADFDHYVRDQSQYYQDLKKETSISRWFILGHSMGGAVALRFALNYQDELSGMILTGPMLRLAARVPKVVRDMARYVAAVTPGLPVVKLEMEAISRDPDVVRNYMNDPLVYTGRVRAGIAVQFNRIDEEMPELMPKVKLPFWVGHGTIDRITDPEGSKMLYKTAASTDKTLKLYDGLFHEIMNEPEKDFVIGEICFWIRKRL
jgi:acylglycerol lipase